MEEALIKRIMPNSLEAEQSVVGSMIMSKDAIVTASEMLLKEDFYHQQYGIIFETMVELFTEGQPVDLVTLQNRLKEKDVPPLKQGFWSHQSIPVFPVQISPIT